MSKLPHDYKIDTRNTSETDRRLLIDFLTSKGYKFYNANAFILDGGTTFVFDWKDDDWCRGNSSPNISLSQFLQLYGVSNSSKPLSEHLSNPTYYEPVFTSELGDIILFPSGIYVKSTGTFIPHSTKELL